MRRIAAVIDPPVIKRPYWFGYLYAAFWGYVTFRCISHWLFGWKMFARHNSEFASLPLQTKAELITTICMWPTLTLLFGWIVYRLIQRKAGMTMIYALVSLHGLSVLFSGAVFYKVAFWAILTAIVIVKFKGYLHSGPSSSKDVLPKTIPVLKTWPNDAVP